MGEHYKGLTLGSGREGALDSLGFRCSLDIWLGRSRRQLGMSPEFWEGRLHMSLPCVGNGTREGNIPCCTSGAAVLGDSLIWCKWKMLLIKNKRKPRKPPPTAEKPLLWPETRWDPDPHYSDFMTPADGRWLRTMVSSMVASNSKHLIKNKI